MQIRSPNPLGCYYSPPDWRHPDDRNKNHARYLDYFHAQVGELCRNYGEMAMRWFDGLEENFTNVSWIAICYRLRLLGPI